MARDGAPMEDCPPDDDPRVVYCFEAKLMQRQLLWRVDPTGLRAAAEDEDWVYSTDPPAAPPMCPPDRWRWELTSAGKRALAAFELAKPEEQAAAGTKPANEKKRVNARMLEQMSKDKECWGWTCKQWARFLGCSAPSVVAADAWKKLEHERLQQQAERARDRHGRGTGRRRGEPGD